MDLAELKDGDHPKGTIAAEVLVVGADDWAINDATTQLQAAGRTVHRCSESAEALLPLQRPYSRAGMPARPPPGGSSRSTSAPGLEAQPTLAEMGAICGLRDRIPLVVAGMPEMSGFSAWAERVPPAGDIVSTCDRVFEESAE